MTEEMRRSVLPSGKQEQIERWLDKDPGIRYKYRPNTAINSTMRPNQPVQQDTKRPMTSVLARRSAPVRRREHSAFSSISAVCLGSNQERRRLDGDEKQEHSSEGLPPPPYTLQRSRTQWDEFKNHIKSISIEHEQNYLGDSSLSSSSKDYISVIEHLYPNKYPTKDIQLVRKSGVIKATSAAMQMKNKLMKSHYVDSQYIDDGESLYVASEHEDVHDTNGISVDVRHGLHSEHQSEARTAKRLQEEQDRKEDQDRKVVRKQLYDKYLKRSDSWASGFSKDFETYRQLAEKRKQKRNKKLKNLNQPKSESVLQQVSLIKITALPNVAGNRNAAPHSSRVATYTGARNINTKVTGQNTKPLVKFGSASFAHFGRAGLGLAS